MSLEVHTTMALTVIETLEGEFVDPNDSTFTTNGMNFADVLDGSSNVPVDMQSAFEIAMVDGAATIDLTSLPGANGEAGAKDGTGKKLQRAMLINKSTNSNPITIVQGASDDYEMLGATFSLTLLPGQKAMFDFNEAAPDIASGDKNIDISGTGTEVLQCHFVMG